MLSDEELMACISKGDMIAFEQLVLRYQASVWRAASRFVGNSAEAQDIAQNVFLKLFHSVQQYKPTALFKTYLFKIVNNSCIDHFRKKRPVCLEENFEIHDDSPSAHDAMVTRERNRMLRQAIDDLPVRQRSAIILRYDAELPIRDIAEILKITEKAVERLLAHAREALHLRLNIILK